VQIDFRSSERSSLGVEVELEIVDQATRELRSGASEVLPVLGRDHPNGEHPKAKHELLESTVEIITGICSTVDEARADLAGTLAELTREPVASRLVLRGFDQGDVARFVELAAGVTIRSGFMNIPVNVAIVPSAAGTRISMLTGFNWRH